VNARVCDEYNGFELLALVLTTSVDCSIDVMELTAMGEIDTILAAEGEVHVLLVSKRDSGETENTLPCATDRDTETGAAPIIEGLTTYTTVGALICVRATESSQTPFPSTTRRR